MRGNLKRATVAIFFIALFSVGRFPRAAAQAGSPFAIDGRNYAYLKQHAFDLRLSEGRLAGPPAGWFRTEPAKAQFLFVGENHDAREIPLIAGALWRELFPLGDRHVAVEAGPWLGDRLDRFPRSGDRQVLTQFQAATWPRLPNNSVPPNSQEDIDFYEQLGKIGGPYATSQPPLIWGLDYEYRATPLLKRLSELSLNSAYRGQIESLRSHVESAEKAGNYKTAVFEPEINELVRVIPTTPGTELFQILDALKVAPLRSVGARRRNRQEAALPAPVSSSQAKRLRGSCCEFGGFHGARGLMPNFGDSTIANLIAEQGVMEGGKMLNVSFAIWPDTPTTDAIRCSWEQEQVLRPFRAAAVGRWTLFDLRGLREPLRRVRFSAAQSQPNSREDAQKVLVTYAFWHQVIWVDAMVLIEDSERSHLPAK